MAVVAASAQPAPSDAAPRTRRYGPLIEDYAPYVGQSSCKPKDKPGVVAFRDLVLAAYPGTRAGSIGRACSAGGSSEHKEGRAWDWGVRAGVPEERKAAEDLLDWLLADDPRGNPHALARRLGIMYVIWRRRIWSTWARGWQVYCVKDEDGCRSPTSGNLVSPHTDHVHFSFSWPGARMRTSFWDVRRSRIADVAGDGLGGYRMVGGNGQVVARGAASYGSKQGFTKRPVVATDATPTGGGYWLLTEGGAVLAFGDARKHGRVRDAGDAVDIEGTPTGAGYWIATADGAVSAFGDAASFGDAAGQGVVVVGMAATATGRGYWLFGSRGEVLPFGDAPSLGDATGRSLPSRVVAGEAMGSDGYWLATRSGRVYAFGAARRHGKLEDGSGVPPVAGIAATPGRGGYWLVGTRGRVAAFGDAVWLGNL